MINREELKKYLNYDPSTGIFTWKMRCSRRVRIGDIAGNLSDKGYMRIAIMGKLYRSHRLAWLYVHGEWPLEQLDHKNRDRKDNRIKNLRLFTGRQNMKNQNLPSNNKSGIMGVNWNPRQENWIARIGVNAKRVGLGSHKSKLDACAARKSAEIKYGYDPTHGRAADFIQ